jgi:glutamate N-acetyltransferase/amino-acid N-acetyltransferase
VTLTVRGARNAAEARQAARTVASSQLVQCSLYGKDPYWGRIISELGVSGAVFDPERVEIAYDTVTVCRDGIAAPHDAAAVAAAMEQRDLTITCDLGNGNSEATMLFTDLTHAYVDENMGTS